MKLEIWMKRLLPPRDTLLRAKRNVQKTSQDFGGAVSVSVQMQQLLQKLL